jgi:hypothetical protein
MGWCCAWGAEERLSYSEIQARANLPDEDVIRILHSLACGKYRILAKEPAGKTINRADTFSINSAFTDRMRRIKARAPRPAPPWRAVHQSTLEMPPGSPIRATPSPPGGQAQHASVSPAAHGCGKQCLAARRCSAAMLG